MIRFFAIILLLALPLVGEASLIDELREKISSRENDIEALEQEIEQFREDLVQTQKEAQTLESAVRSLDITSRKLRTDINVTENQISGAELTIEKLSLEIDDKERRIAQNKEALSAALRRLNALDNDTLAEALLRHDKLSDFWGEVNVLQQFQQSIQTDVEVLFATRNDLTATVIQQEHTKEELEDYRSKLSGQRRVVEINKQEKDELLDETKSRESLYQEILAEKLEQRERFERELREFESELQVAIDPNTLPSEGTEIFTWPLEKPIRITQLFGHTAFAAANPSVYGGRAHHPGVDFGVPVGAPIIAPLGGTVWRIGNTDAIPGCYSWGKWILLRHNNGLSTLYAHLSLIDVNEGDVISTGDIIGYSGNTGYSTGPHLHFTVYATEGVSIVPFENIRRSTNCKGAVTPAAPSNAYIDPMWYLPDDYTLSL